MERLDFCSLAGIIKEYCNDEKLGSQLDYVEKIFHTCVYGEETDVIYFDETQVCRWLKGQINISRTIIAYYIDSEEHQNSLRTDIENRIVSCIYDKEMAVNKLKELMLNDTTISASQKEKLLINYGIDADEQIAAFITDLLLFAMERKFIKRNSEKKLLTSGEYSPVIADYIFENDTPAPCKFFCGRDTELEELHETLISNDKIFLYGIAGIGKSELAKAYARKYKKNYANILYITYSGSLTDDIAALDFADDLPGESTEERFKKHNRFLRSLKDDTLIIVDNYDTTTEKDNFLSVMMKYKCRILFATRSSFYDYEKFELSEINDIDALLALVSKFYEYSDREKDIIREIIETVHCHTFTVELTARLLHTGMLSPEELLQKLKEENIKLSSSDTIGIKKDGAVRKDSYYGHIHTLFSLSVLDEAQLSIMRYISLVPLTGIDKRLFAKWTVQPDMNTINSLIELGFIKELPMNRICLHPMMKEITIADTSPSVTNCGDMLTYIHNNIIMYHGADVPYTNVLFKTIENIMDTCEKDDIPSYLLFIEDAFVYMDNYNYESGMRKILSEMDLILKNSEIGTNSDRVLFYDYSAMMKCDYDHDLSNALKLEEKSISLLPEAAHESAVLISNVYTNYGRLLHKKGDFVPAEQYMRMGIDILRKYHLEYSNDMVIKICNYAVILSSMGNHDQALTVLRKNRKIVKDHISDTCHDYALIEEAICRIYLSVGNVNDATDHLKKALSIYAKIWSEQPELIEQKYAELQEDFMKAGIRMVPPDQYFLLKN